MCVCGVFLTKGSGVCTGDVGNKVFGSRMIGCSRVEKLMVVDMDEMYGDRGMTD